MLHDEAEDTTAVELDRLSGTKTAARESEEINQRLREESRYGC